jgi:hypothetical protein
MDYILPEDYENLKNDPINLFSAIYNIKDKEKRKLFLIEINHKDNIDICEYAVKAIENGHNASYINIMLRNAIEELKLNKESLLKYFRLINQSSQGSTYSSIQYSQIHNISLKQPAFAEDFLEYLIPSNDPIVSQYIVEIILSLEQINNKEKQSKLLLMANSDVDSTSICGISGLGRIKYITEDDRKLVNKTLSCFDSLIKQEQHMINGAITNSLGHMYYLGDQIISRLINLSKRNDSYILMEIVKFLYFEYKTISKEYFFEPLLLSLTKVNSDQIGIIKELDTLLYSMVESEYHIELFIKFLLAWTTESDCKPNKISTMQMLDMVFSGIYTKYTTLQKIILLLFNNDNILSPQLAEIIITSNMLPIEQNIYFDSNSVSILDDVDIIFICRRILGYIIHPELIISLFYSILLGKKENKKSVGFICNYFNKYIGYNYPKTTIKFIDSILTCTESDILCKDILLTILENAKRIDKERTEKQRFKELEPSRNDSYLLYKEEWQSNQKYIELAKRKSIIDLIASKSYIKYGKSASYHIDGHITEGAPFKEFSYPMEHAYDLIVDPVGFNIDRFIFRNTGRNEN